MRRQTLKDLISRRVRIEVREYFTGTSLAIIDMAFGGADLAADRSYVPPESGQRRALVEQYYHAIDWTSWANVKKFLLVIETVLLELRQEANSKSVNADYAAKALEKITHYLEKDGFALVDGQVVPPASTPQLADFRGALRPLNAPELHRQLERLRDAADEDPPLAIGTAKELVESTCKTILADHKVTPLPGWDLVRLVKETRTVLKLLPDDIPESAKGAEIIRRLLANLGTIAQGVGELRNLYGTGHGRSGAAGALTPRHARLAVGAAATLVTFLLETHWSRTRT